MPAQLTCLGITCVLLSFHICFLSFVALKQIPFLLKEVTVYLQPMFFPKLLGLCLGWDCICSPVLTDGRN